MMPSSVCKYLVSAFTAYLVSGYGQSVAERHSGDLRNKTQQFFTLLIVWKRVVKQIGVLRLYRMSRP